MIPDFLVAHLYGVQTIAVNQAVKNNPDKFPNGFILEYSKEEKAELVKNFDQFNLKHSSAVIKVFTERGLYTLATILKSDTATQTTLAIVNTFAEVRELKRNLLVMHDSPQTTEVKRPLPKAQLYKQWDWKPLQRESFDGDASCLDFVNWISPRTPRQFKILTLPMWDV